MQSHSRVGGYDDHSDESETSSVCSERSIDSVNRRSDVILDEIKVFLISFLTFFLCES